MIEKYLLSTCLFVIDDFNEQYKAVPVQSDELNQIAYGYTEADLTVRIGYPFRQMAKFVMQSSRGKSSEHGGNDIVVESRDFRIEVKFLKTQKSIYGADKNKSHGWKQIKDDFDWLTTELSNPQNKGKRAFVIGWFNSTKSFSNLMPLGMSIGGGGNRPIDDEKFRYFPFLDYPPNKKRTDEITYRYNVAFEPQTINLPGFNGPLRCLFLGQTTDKFHMLIYY